MNEIEITYITKIINKILFIYKYVKIYIKKKIKFNYFFFKNKALFYIIYIKKTLKKINKQTNTRKNQAFLIF
jgi:hypothetical protein